MIGHKGGLGSATQLAQQYQSASYPGMDLPRLYTQTFDQAHGKATSGSMFGDVAGFGGLDGRGYGDFVEQASGMFGAPLRITIEHPPMSDGQVAVNAKGIKWGDVDPEPVDYVDAVASQLRWGDEDLAALVDFGISRASGNCVAGTAEWCQKYLGDPRQTYTVRQVLGAALTSRDRVDDAMRACWGAVCRSREHYGTAGYGAAAAQDPAASLYLSPRQIAELRKQYPNVGDKRFNAIVKQREAAMRKAASEAAKNQEKIIKAQAVAAGAGASSGFDANAAVADVAGAAQTIFGQKQGTKGQGLATDTGVLSPPPPGGGDTPPPASPAKVGAAVLAGLALVGVAVAVKRKRKAASKLASKVAP